MTIATDLLDATKLHARVDHGEDDPDILLMLAAAVGDIAHAAAYTMPEAAADLPDDLRLAIIDHAALLYDARAQDTDQPKGLSHAAARIASRYRGVRVIIPEIDEEEA